jgi:hypothetical protein
MREVWPDQAPIQRYLDVEKALSVARDVRVSSHRRPPMAHSFLDSCRNKPYWIYHKW